MSDRFIIDLNSGPVLVWLILPDGTVVDKTPPDRRVQIAGHVRPIVHAGATVVAVPVKYVGDDATRPA